MFLAHLVPCLTQLLEAAISPKKVQSCLVKNGISRKLRSGHEVSSSLLRFHCLYMLSVDRRGECVYVIYTRCKYTHIHFYIYIYLWFYQYTEVRLRVE